MFCKALQAFRGILILQPKFRELLFNGILADRFFVSKATLIYNFNKYASCSPMDFLLNVRLTKAKDMLINSGKSVGEISDECGFSSANYFGLIFKKKEGLSPLQYRKNQRSKV